MLTINPGETLEVVIEGVGTIYTLVTSFDIPTQTVEWELTDNLNEAVVDANSAEVDVA